VVKVTDSTSATAEMGLGGRRDFGACHLRDVAILFDSKRSGVTWKELLVEYSRAIGTKL